MWDVLAYQLMIFGLILVGFVVILYIWVAQDTTAKAWKSETPPITEAYTPVPEPKPEIRVFYTVDPQFNGIQKDIFGPYQPNPQGEVVDQYMQMSLLPWCMPPTDNLEQCQILRERYPRTDLHPLRPYERNKLGDEMPLPPLACTPPVPGYS